MHDGFDAEEDKLQYRQGGTLYPIGRSLRSTFSSPEDEELQPRITSLMVELSHQPYEPMPCETRGADRADPTPHQGGGKEASGSLLHQLARFLRRH